MIPTVYILATCPEAKGIDAATLVFKTLRIGFPTARVVVDIQGDLFASQTVYMAADNAKCHLGRSLAGMRHAKWISHLVQIHQSPFWICDTDVVFHESMEDVTSDEALLGRFQPEFHDPATHCRTKSRLHTSLLRIDPVKFRAAVKDYEDYIRLKRFAPPADYWNPIVLPIFPGPVFFDCGAIAYHALGGQAFTEEENARFDHLHNATYLDEIAPLLPELDLPKTHAAVHVSPSLLKGAYKTQMEWFKKHAA
jgi:hypothetical protein